ncbi:hypothetical protein F5Y07DRAFT_394595 [Xylaria sp. FL0933]|nr:hypothetical protein F5Y07DRAFT_394595 [Xylaria sp. FL0933]
MSVESSATSAIRHRREDALSTPRMRCIEFRYLDEHGPWMRPVAWSLRDASGQTGNYIALSHRRDDNTEKTGTLVSNYACRSGLNTHTVDSNAVDDPSQLPALFYDACEDREDWNSGSKNMDDYYQHAWLTIAIMMPSTLGELFKRSQDISDLPRVTRLPYRNRYGQQDGHFYVQAISDGMLAFSKSGIFVQCQRGPPKSLDGHGVLSSPRGSTRTLRVDLAFKSSTPLALTTPLQICAAWEDVVQTFSGLHVTRIEEDGLVALAGIAHEFGEAFGAHHHASFQRPYGNPASTSRWSYAWGLWSNWDRALQWKQIATGPRLRIEGIPTWSWASMVSDEKGTNHDIVRKGISFRWATPSAENRVHAPHSSVEVTTVEYNNDKRFAILEVNGPMLQVNLRGPFESLDADFAADLAGYNPDFGRGLWRNVG